MTLNHSKTWPITTTIAVVQLRINRNGRTYSTLTEQQNKNFLTDPKRQNVFPDENCKLNSFNVRTIGSKNSTIVDENLDNKTQNQVRAEVNFQIATIDVSKIDVVNNPHRSSYGKYEDKIVSIKDERQINRETNEINPDFIEISRDFNDIHRDSKVINQDSNQIGQVYHDTNRNFNETSGNYNEIVCLDGITRDDNKTCESHVESVDDTIILPLSKRHVEMFTKMSNHPTKQTIRTDTVSTILEQDSEQDYERSEAIGECSY